MILGSPGSSPADSEPASAIDQAIDVVAREMTRMEAPATMRAEVLARIEGEGERAAGQLPRWAWAAGMAVIVMAVAATVWFGRPGDQPESVTARHDSSSIPAAGAAKPQPQPSGTLANAGLATGAGSARHSQSQSAPVRTGVRHGAGVTGGNTPAAETAGAVEETGPSPLAQPDPIAIAALGPDAIHIPDIGVEPLVDLKPITIQDIPVGSTEIQSPSIRRFDDDPTPSGLCAEQAH
ncbi:MAG: hypothetical protein NT151_05915 [Acidobacteria bacterium]|nr:hypothetical protein [Acidobacteriota bacterium]